MEKKDPLIKNIPVTDAQKKIVATKCYTRSPQNKKWHYHTHDDYELYCFLAGEGANYGIESNFYKLKPGDVILIKKGKAHDSMIKGEAPYIRYVINFTSEALLDEQGKLAAFLENLTGDNEYYPSAYFREKNWTYYFSQICSTQDFYKRQIYLTILVNELRENATRMINTKLGKKDTIADVVFYINSNITYPLTLDSICEKFFISKAHLNRRFSDVLGQTVWQYIVSRRLTIARERLFNGEHPTEVATLCGFADYNTFFKAYKAKYGVSPKDDRVK